MVMVSQEDSVQDLALVDLRVTVLEELATEDQVMEEVPVLEDQATEVQAMEDQVTEVQVLEDQVTEVTVQDSNQSYQATLVAMAAAVVIATEVEMTAAVITMLAAV